MNALNPDTEQGGVKLRHAKDVIPDCSTAASMRQTVII